MAELCRPPENSCSAGSAGRAPGLEPAGPACDDRNGGATGQACEGSGTAGAVVGSSIHTSGKFLVLMYLYVYNLKTLFWGGLGFCFVFPPGRC